MITKLFIFYLNRKPYVHQRTILQIRAIANRNTRLGRLHAIRPKESRFIGLGNFNTQYLMYHENSSARPQVKWPERNVQNICKRKQTQNSFWCCSCYFQLTALYLVHMVLSSVISVGFLVIQTPEMNLSDSGTLSQWAKLSLQNSSLERDIFWKITIYCKESHNWVHRRALVTVWELRVPGVEIQFTEIFSCSLWNIKVIYAGSYCVMGTFNTKHSRSSPVYGSRKKDWEYCAWEP